MYTCSIIFYGNINKDTTTFQFQLLFLLSTTARGRSSICGHSGATCEWPLATLKAAASGHYQLQTSADG